MKLWFLPLQSDSVLGLHKLHFPLAEDRFLLLEVALPWIFTTIPPSHGEKTSWEPVEIQLVNK